jgi:hypothetical protein
MKIEISKKKRDEILEDMGMPTLEEFYNYRNDFREVGATCGELVNYYTAGMKLLNSGLLNDTEKDNIVQEAIHVHISIVTGEIKNVTE